MARKYTKVEELAEIVRERHQQGESYREIAGSYKVEEGSGLPKPSENLILAGDKLITYSDLHVPSTKELKNAFCRAISVIMR